MGVAGRDGRGYKAEMALNKELIDILACPKCKGPLDLHADESAFDCPVCRLSYKVVDDIPNFIVEEAEPLAARG
jgi:uncharacterized protein YbaR (Trm112 family)